MEHGKLGHCEKLNTENIPPLKMVKHVVSDRSLFFLEQNCLFLTKWGGGASYVFEGASLKIPVMFLLCLTQEKFSHILMIFPCF